MAISKVEFGGNTIIDITDTTITEDDVIEGKIFYKADGTRGVGTLKIEAGTTLYENSSGSASTITLSDSVSNYSYLEIFFGWEQLDFGTLSTKYEVSLGGNVNLATIVQNGNYIYYAVSEWTPSGTSITQAKGEYWRGRVATSNAFTRTQDNKVAIYKVVGYK